MSKRNKTLLGENEKMIADLERGGYESVKDAASEVKRYTKLFRESGNKVRRVNIRMTERDVEKAQALALREGIPYATLMTNVLHRYFTGRLKEAES